MTYTDWADKHLASRQEIQGELEAHGCSREQVIDYFDFDSMVVNEPDFCPLYKTNTKCHSTGKLNCYLCACPHFKCADEPLETRIDGTKVFSVCMIASTKANTFNSDGNIHCDCSSCLVPHNTSVALKHYDTSVVHRPIQDSCSILEHIRAFQLSDIFGKYKLF